MLAGGARGMACLDGKLFMLHRSVEDVCECTYHNVENLHRSVLHYKSRAKYLLLGNDNGYSYYLFGGCEIKKKLLLMRIKNNPFNWDCR